MSSGLDIDVRNIYYEKIFEGEKNLDGSSSEGRMMHLDENFKKEHTTWWTHGFDMPLTLFKSRIEPKPKVDMLFGRHSDYSLYVTDISLDKADHSSCERGKAFHKNQAKDKSSEGQGGLLTGSFFLPTMNIANRIVGETEPYPLEHTYFQLCFHSCVPIDGFKYTFGGVCTGKGNDFSHLGLPLNVDPQRVSVYFPCELPPFVQKDVLVNPYFEGNQLMFILNSLGTTVSIVKPKKMSKPYRLLQASSCKISTTHVLIYGGYELCVKSVQYIGEIDRWVIEKDLIMNKDVYLFDSRKLKFSQMRINLSSESVQLGCIGGCILSDYSDVNNFSVEQADDSSLNLVFGQDETPMSENVSLYKRFLNQVSKENEVASNTQTERESHSASTTTESTSRNMSLGKDVSEQSSSTLAKLGIPSSMPIAHVKNYSNLSPSIPFGRIFGRNNQRRSNNLNKSTNSNSSTAQGYNTSGESKSMSSSRPVSSSLGARSGLNGSSIHPPQSPSDSLASQNSYIKSNSGQKSGLISEDRKVSGQESYFENTENLSRENYFERGTKVFDGKKIQHQAELRNNRVQGDSDGSTTITVFVFGGFICREYEKYKRFIASSDLIEIKISYENAPYSAKFREIADVRFIGSDETIMKGESFSPMWPTARGFCALALIDNTTNENCLWNVASPSDSEYNSDTDKVHSYLSSTSSASSASSQRKVRNYLGSQNYNSLSLRGKAMMVHGGCNEKYETFSDLYLFFFDTGRWQLLSTYIYDFGNAENTSVADEDPQNGEQSVSYGPGLLDAELRCCHHQAIYFKNDDRDYIIFLPGFSNEFLKHFDKEPYTSDKCDVSEFIDYDLGKTSGSLQRIPVLQVQTQTWKFLKYSASTKCASTIKNFMDREAETKLFASAGAINLYGKRITFCHGIISYLPKNKTKTENGFPKSKYILLGAVSQIIFPCL